MSTGEQNGRKRKPTISGSRHGAPRASGLSNITHGHLMYLAIFIFIARLLYWYYFKMTPPKWYTDGKGNEWSGFFMKSNECFHIWTLEAEPNGDLSPLSRRTRRSRCSCARTDLRLHYFYRRVFSILQSYGKTQVLCLDGKCKDVWMALTRTRSNEDKWERVVGETDVSV